MRRGAAHLTLVVGDPAKAGRLRRALEEQGVDHAAVVARVESIRRSLVLGENDFVVVCIALDRATIDRDGKALRSLLSDNQCFPTTVRTIGLLSDLGLTRDAAELGCDVYVDDSTQAARVIRLLDDAWNADGGESKAPAPVRRPARPRRRFSIRGGWMFGAPELPPELASLVGAEQGGWGAASEQLHPRAEGSGGDFGDPDGPP